MASDSQAGSGSAGTPPPPDATLDALGLRCPEPLMLARNRLRAMAAGEVLHIVATDPSTERDFTNLCRFMGHEMLAMQRSDDRLEFWIRKG